MKRSNSSFVAVLAAALIASGLAPIGFGLSVPVASATTVSFGTPQNSTVLSGEPVDAQATFVTSANTVTITMYNLQTNTKSVDQNISDLTFGLSNGKNKATISSSSGLERTVHSDRSYTDGAVVPTDWKVSTFGSDIVLDDGWYANAGPAHTIIGPASGSSYPHADKTIAGNQTNNPFLAGPVTFVLNVTGVTANTKITDVTFYFGPCEACVTACPVTPVPEPTGLTLAALGVALAAWRWRRQAH